jgi:hypothetical protein
MKKKQLNILSTYSQATICTVFTSVGSDWFLSGNHSRLALPVAGLSCTRSSLSVFKSPEKKPNTFLLNAFKQLLHR